MKFARVDDTIASHTAPSSQAMHPIKAAYDHQSHMKKQQNNGQREQGNVPMVWQGRDLRWRCWKSRCFGEMPTLQALLQGSTGWSDGGSHRAAQETSNTIDEDLPCERYSSLHAFEHYWLTAGANATTKAGVMTGRVCPALFRSFFLLSTAAKIQKEIFQTSH